MIEKRKKVYCEDCNFNNTFGKCKNPKFIKITSDAINKKIKTYPNCKDINKNNDCKGYEYNNLPIKIIIGIICFLLMVIYFFLSIPY